MNGSLGVGMGGDEQIVEGSTAPAAEGGELVQRSGLNGESPPVESIAGPPALPACEVPDAGAGDPFEEEEGASMPSAPPEEEPTSRSELEQGEPSPLGCPTAGNAFARRTSPEETEMGEISELLAEEVVDTKQAPPPDGLAEEQA